MLQLSREILAEISQQVEKGPRESRKVHHISGEIPRISAAQAYFLKKALL